MSQNLKEIQKDDISFNLILNEILNHYLKIKESHVILFDFITKYPNYIDQLLDYSNKKIYRLENTILSQSKELSSVETNNNNNNENNNENNQCNTTVFHNNNNDEVEGDTTVILNNKSSQDIKDSNNINNILDISIEKSVSSYNTGNNKDEVSSMHSFVPSVDSSSFDPNQLHLLTKDDTDKENNNSKDDDLDKSIVVQDHSPIQIVSEDDDEDDDELIDVSTQRNPVPMDWNSDDRDYDFKDQQQHNKESDHSNDMIMLDDEAEPLVDQGNKSKLIEEYQILKKDFEYIVNSTQIHSMRLNELCQLLAEKLGKSKSTTTATISGNTFSQDSNNNYNHPTQTQPNTIAENNPNGDHIIDMDILEETITNTTLPHQQQQQNLSLFSKTEPYDDTVNTHVERLQMVNQNFGLIVNQFKDNISIFNRSLQTNSKLNRCFELVENLIKHLHITGCDQETIYSDLEIKLVQLTTITTTTTTTTTSSVYKTLNQPSQQDNIDESIDNGSNNHSYNEINSINSGSSSNRGDNSENSSGNSCSGNHSNRENNEEVIEFKLKVEKLEKDNHDLSLAVEQLTSSLAYFTEKEKKDGSLDLVDDDQASSQKQKDESERQKLIDRIKDLELENAQLTSTSNINRLKEENQHMNEIVNRLEQSEKQLLNNNNLLNSELEELQSRLKISENQLKLQHERQDQKYQQIQQPPQTQQQDEKPKSLDLDSSFSNDSSMYSYATQPAEVNVYEVNYRELLYLLHIDSNESQLNHHVLIKKIHQMIESNFTGSAEIDKQKEIIQILREDLVKSTEEKEKQIEAFLKDKEERELYFYEDKRNALKQLEKELTEKQQMIPPANFKSPEVEQEIEDLKYRLNCANSEVCDNSCIIASQHEKNNVLTNQVAALSEKVAEKDQHIMTLSLEIESLKKLSQSLSDKLEDQTIASNTNIDNLNEENVKLQIIVEKMEEKHKAMESSQAQHISSLEEELLVAKNKCLQLESEKKLEQELVKSLNLNITQLGSLRVSLTESKEANKKLQSDMEALFERIDKLNDRVKEQDEEIDHLLKQKTDAQLQIAPLKDEIERNKSNTQLLEKLANDFSTMKNLYQEKTEQADHLSKKYSTKKTEFNELLTKSEQLESTLKERQDLFEQAIQEQKSLQLALETAKKKEKQLEDFKAENELLKRELADVKQSIELLQSQQSQQSNIYRKREDELNQNALDAKSKLLEQMKEFNEIKQKYEQILIVNEDLTNNCQQLTKEKEKLTTSLESMKLLKDSSSNGPKDVELRTTKKELDYVKQKIDELSKQLVIKNNLIEQLQNSSTSTTSSIVNLINNVSQPQQQPQQQQPQQQQPQQQQPQLQQPQLQQPLQPITSATSTDQIESKPQLDNEIKPVPQPGQPTRKQLKLIIQPKPQPQNNTANNTNNNKKRSLETTEQSTTTTTTSSSSSLLTTTTTTKTTDTNNNKRSRQDANSQGNYTIMLTGFKSDTEKDSLAEMVKKMNGIVRTTNEYDRHITHVVSGSNPTMKTITGTLTHKWILSPQWITDSFEKGKFINEENYGYRSLIKPFEGKKIFITPQFEENSRLTKKNIISLVTTIGKGTIVEKTSEADLVLIGNEAPIESSRHLNWRAFLNLIHPQQLKPKP